MKIKSLQQNIEITHASDKCFQCSGAPIATVSIGVMERFFPVVMVVEGGHAASVLGLYQILVSCRQFCCAVHQLGDNDS